jgi:hypothetical protein
MSNYKAKVYVPIKCAERLPEKDDCYYTGWNDKFDDNEFLMIAGANLWQGNDFDTNDDGIEGIQPDIWLEPVSDAYLFTKEELEKLLTDAFINGKKSSIWMSDYVKSKIDYLTK